MLKPRDPINWKHYYNLFYLSKQEKSKKKQEPNNNTNFQHGTMAYIAKAQAAVVYNVHIDFQSV